MRYLYAMYSLVDVWKEMSRVVEAVDEELSDATVEELVKNYAIRLSNLVGNIICLHRVDAEVGRNLLRYILNSMKMRLENSLSSNAVHGVDGLLGIAVRFQVLSKKRIWKLLRDLRYVEHILDKDVYNAAESIIHVGSVIAEYIERSWKRIRKMSLLSRSRKKGRYGERGSKELRFVKAVKSLIKQVKLLKGILAEIEGLENIRYLDRDEFAFEVKTMLRNSFPCFLYANHVVCVDITDVRSVLDEAEDIVRYAIAFCRYCLGKRVKPPIQPCYEGDEECWSRFCSLYDEFFELVEYYRGLLTKLRRNLRARAKMRKRRYSSRLKKLIRKFSKLRTLDGFIYGTNLDPFKCALTVFSSWLRRRGYKQLHEFDPHCHANQHYIGSTEAYDKFTRLVYYINGWVDRIEKESSHVQKQGIANECNIPKYAS